MKVVTVVGARPQFIKAAPVSVALREASVREVLVHTGQHYDAALSAVFFRELGIPEPDVNLEAGSGSHAVQTAQIMMRLEGVLLAEMPDCVIVYGDTNSTLAAALTAAKLSIPVAHIEAGLRSFNRTMPEEINRVVTDRLSELLFCPTAAAVANLEVEGISEGVHNVGDVMYDALLHFLPLAEERASRLPEHGVEPGAYCLATLHRAGNTDDPDRLRRLLGCLEAAGQPVLFPVHPRTRALLDRHGLALPSNVRSLPPQGYLDMLILQKNARIILTDSGGMQKEAFWLGVPCITLREETEWGETVAAGWNHLAGADPERVRQALSLPAPAERDAGLYGDGDAARRIVALLQEHFRSAR